MYQTMLDRAQSRDRRYKLALWLNIGLQFIMQVLMVLAYETYTDDPNDPQSNRTSIIFFSLSYSTLVITTIAISLILFIGLFKFYSIVSCLSKTSNIELALKTVVAISLSLFGWTILVLVEEICFLGDYDNLTGYQQVKQTVRITTWTAFLDLALFLTLGYMLNGVSLGKINQRKFGSDVVSQVSSNMNTGVYGSLSTDEIASMKDGKSPKPRA